jgi:predicted dehydrogenase
MLRRVSRRKFLRQSGRSVLASGALAAATPAAIARSAPGANERVTLGWIGCGNRRKRLIPGFLQHPDARISVVCDVSRGRAEMAQRLVAEQGGGEPEILGDYRRVLERSDVDAVVVATPEHWKCLPTLHACQAGKDVYVEKPLARTVAEGRLMIQAARKYDRVVMIGTQQRSMQCYREAVEFIHSGKLGKISEVRSWNFENLAPHGYGNPPDQESSPGLDWDLWLGPAPKVLYNPNRYHSFHFFWDYGGGWQTDWAVHMYDIIHWAMKEDTPISAAAAGAKFARRDNTELPDTFEVVFEYPGFLSLYSYRHGNGRVFEDMWYGNAFYGENGTLAINRDGWRVIPEPVDMNDPEKRKVMRMAATGGPGSPTEPEHQLKFIEAVKAHRPPETADVEMGHRSTIPGHLANIAYRTGRKVYWDAEKEQVKSDPEANRLLTPTYRKPWVLEL